MIRLRVYTGLSLVATLAVIYHGFSSRGQFYPAMVYLSTSKISLVLLLNMCLVIMFSLWQLVKCVFLGSLREAEIERLNEQAWRELMEILFAITIFRQDFSVVFLTMVVTLLLIKALHWMAQKRMEYIETTPTVPTLSHIRIVSFFCFLLLLDGLFMYSSIRHLIQSRQASVSLFFSFEYMILATTTISLMVKYVFYVSDMIMEGQWEKKPVYTFYLELIRDLLHLSMYICFFLVIFMNYGVPLHLLRELYETFRNFKIRVADYLRYRKITSNMNDRFPDATPEELNANDATCIICREEMTTAKKLICGHLFHVHCLRSWLERQHTCPTCRALVVPPENATSTVTGQRGSQQDTPQQGTGASSSDSQSSSIAASDDNFSRHQARLQAAASAASIYGKSFVYPSANSLVWSSGNSLVPQSGFPGSSEGVEQVSSQPHRMVSSAEGVRFPSPQSFPPGFLPFQLPSYVASGEISDVNSEISKAQLEAQRKFLQSQIDVLRNQLRLLEKPESADSSAETDNDVKGKSIAEMVE